MTFTIDQVRELVPEATSIVQSGEHFRLTIDSCRYYTLEPATKLLLETRLKLAKARKALREIDLFDEYEPAGPATYLARQTLEETK